jgi:hypothetical protein
MLDGDWSSDVCSSDLAKKTFQATDYAMSGQYRKAAEAVSPEFLSGPLRAHRLATEGQTTAMGKQVLDENKQPVKYTTGEAIARGFGFQPLDKSRGMEIEDSMYDLKAHWEGRKDNLQVKVSSLVREGKIDQAKKLVQDFNQDLLKSQAKGLVPYVEKGTIDAWMKPKFNKREALFKRQIAK